MRLTKIPTKQLHNPMKNKNIIWSFIIALCVMTSSAFAQEKEEKLSERFSTNENVEIRVDTRYADVIFETWNKDEVSIEAYVEGENATEAAKQWKLDVQGNSKAIQIVGREGYTDARVVDLRNLNDLNLNLDLTEIIGGSLSVVEPVMNGLIGPLLEGISGTPLPREFYEETSKMHFDHEAYRKEGQAYIQRWEKEMDKSFGPDFERKMERWEKEVSQKADDWSERLVEKSGIPRWPFKGSRNMSFDTNEYEKDKKAYVAKLNKKYGTDVSVREVDRWLESLDEWGKDFGKSMEIWGESFGKSMEAWGENFGDNLGKSMEAWGESFGRDMEDFGKKIEKWAEENQGNFRESRTTTKNSNNSTNSNLSWNSETSKRKPTRTIKRIIKIRMPKKAALDLNVRYGKVQVADAHNAKATITHGSLAANTIEGTDTFIEVAYSPIEIAYWESGSLKTSQVKECTIATAKDIALTANSSNISITKLTGNGMITGSFGKLLIPEIDSDFGSLTIVLQNSDLALKLPKSAFNFTYSGDHNTIMIPKQLDTKGMRNGASEMISGYHKNRGSSSVISINAKYSDIALQ